MARIIKLKESDITNIVKKILTENKKMGKKRCCKWEWVSNDDTAGGWICTKWCSDKVSNDAPEIDLNKIQMKENSRGMSEGRLNEKEEKKCCVCWSLEPVGGWVSTSGEKWKCCGWAPCSKMFGGKSEKSTKG